MNKTLKLIFLFGGTVLLWGVGLVVFFGVIFKTLKDNQALATFEAPGTAEFEISEAGSITIWHDYETHFEGSFVRNEKSLPTGFQFEVSTDSGESMPALTPSRMTTTMKTGVVEKIAVGTLNMAEAGNYRIKVNGPESDPRIISVSRGVFKETFMGILSGIGGIFLFGLLGIVTLIFGIVVAFTKPTFDKPPL